MLPVLIMFGVMMLMSTSWMAALMIVAGMVVLFAVNLIMSQESMLYVPCVVAGMQRPSHNPEGMRSPADRGLEFEDVNLKTTDGVRIHGWFMPAAENPSTAPTILFCHANAGNIGLRVPNYAQMIEKLQANVFALDYRGYGNSEGTPSEDGLIEDALTAWQWLCTAADEGRIDGKRIFVFGRSLGGAVSVALARTLQTRDVQPLPCGVILENTFISISALVDTLFPIIAFDVLKKRFLRLRWETGERIKDIKVPLLFLTGQKDEMIPPSHSATLQASAEKSPHCRQVVFPEGTHNDTWEKGGDKYWESWTEFVEECCSSKFLAVKADS